VRKDAPTRKEFEAMAGLGRLWGAEEKSPRTPTEAELARAETPLDYGRLYGYSENDIAHFYSHWRRGHPSGYEYVRDLAEANVAPGGEVIGQTAHRPRHTPCIPRRPRQKGESRSNGGDPARKDRRKR